MTTDFEYRHSFKKKYSQSLSQFRLAAIPYVLMFGAVATRKTWLLDNSLRH